MNQPAERRQVVGAVVLLEISPHLRRDRWRVELAESRLELVGRFDEHAIFAERPDVVGQHLEIRLDLPRLGSADSGKLPLHGLGQALLRLFVADVSGNQDGQAGQR